jgi:hypothetical protein
MFDHVKFGVTHDEASKTFFREALAPLGVIAGAERPAWCGIEIYIPDGQSSCCIFQTDEKPAQLHLAFVAADRPQYDTTCLAAFALDPDGHNIEAVCHAGAD